MSSKKKLIISLSSFIVVLLAAVIAVVAVLAATSASVKSGITITYTVSPEITGTVTYNYALAATSDSDFGTANEQEFTVGDSDISEDYNIPELTLDIETNFVVIKIDYALSNSVDQESVDSSISVKITEGEEYFDVYIAHSGMVDDVWTAIDTEDCLKTDENVDQWRTGTILVKFIANSTAQAATEAVTFSCSINLSFGVGNGE